LITKNTKNTEITKVLEGWKRLGGRPADRVSPCGVRQVPKPGPLLVFSMWLAWGLWGTIDVSNALFVG
jgi:hypothetical protein